MSPEDVENAIFCMDTFEHIEAARGEILQFRLRNNQSSGGDGWNNRWGLHALLISQLQHEASCGCFVGKQQALLATMF